MRKKDQIKIKYVLGIFLLVRFFLLISIPYEGIRGYGDHWNYFSQAEMGTPFINYWTEFPPLFPFLTKLLFILAAGREHTFTYLLYIVMSVCQAGNIYLFHRLLDSLPRGKTHTARVVLYAGILAGVGYGWGYFDPLVNVSILSGMVLLLQGRHILSSVTIAVGTLTKWFPLLLLPAGWKIIRQKRRFLLIAGVIILCLLGVWGTLYTISPEMTEASLISQFRKGSWETIWALLDGNIKTGNFGPEVNRLLPGTINEIKSQPAVIPPWGTFLLFAAFGLIIFLTINVTAPEDYMNFVGLTMVLFFIWSPGYSPQWMLYSLPFILLMLPFRESLLMAVVWTLVHLLEWPLLLSRGFFEALYFVIPLRTALFVLLGFLFYRGLWKRERDKQKPV